MDGPNSEGIVFKWFPIIQWLIGGVIALSFFIIMWTVWIVQNVPKTSYVDEHFKKAMDYTDLKITELTKQIQVQGLEFAKQLETQGKAVTEDAHNWSNANKASILIEFNKQISTLSAQQNMLIDELRMLRQSQAYEQGRRNK